MITDGKWEVVTEAEGGFNTFFVKSDQGDNLECVDICEINMDELKEAKANANLIAAAPALLEALKIAKSLMNASTLLDAGNPANIAIEQALALAEPK
jgi:hypothetical protein